MSGIVRLQLRLLNDSRLRGALMALLVSVSLCVFVVMSSLSSAASASLDAAVTRELGKTGTYAVTLPSTFGMTTGDAAMELDKVLSRIGTDPLVVQTVQADLGCGAPGADTTTALGVVLIGDAAAHDVVYGSTQNDRRCLAGVEIPTSDLFEPAPGNEVPGVPATAIVGLQYSQLASATGANSAISGIVTTGKEADESTQITALLMNHFQTLAERNGEPLYRGSMMATRTDGGAEIRDVSSGIRVVYSVIAWSVLGLSALGLLITEMMVVRQRYWFYGLARMVGARNSQIVALVLLDLLAILLVAAAVSFGCLAAIGPMVNRFSQESLGAGASVGGSQTVVRMVVAIVAVLTVGAFGPAQRALKADPVDVLEGAS